MKTMKDLRQFMTEELLRLRSGDSTPASVNAAANMSGKITSSIKLELEYNKMIGASPKIDFLIDSKDEQKKLEKPKE